jgi:chloramphenicol 3-O phosphotransferase
MYASFAGLARAGLNVIADDVIYDEQVLGSAVAALHGLPAYFVGIHCPLAIAEQRERERGDRLIGGAGVFFNDVHDGKIYDFPIDSSLLSPSAAATAIADHIKKGSAPWAFRRLYDGTQS